MVGKREAASPAFLVAVSSLGLPLSAPSLVPCILIGPLKPSSTYPACPISPFHVFPYLVLGQQPLSQVPALLLPETLQPALTLSAFSPHPEKYMEFDLNGDGDIGEKRVFQGSVRTQEEGGLPWSATFLVVWERVQLLEEELEWKCEGKDRERERERGTPFFHPSFCTSRYHGPEANAGETWCPQDPSGAQEINQGGVQQLWGDLQLL